MKRNDWSWCIVVGIVAAVIASVGVEPVMAERGPGFSSGVNVGVSRFSDGDLGTGFSGRVFVEYAPYIHEIALKLSGGYLRFEDEITLGEGSFTSKQDVVFEDLYLTGGIVYRFSRGQIVPFVTGNLGIYHYRKDDVSSAAGPIIDGTQASPFDTVNSKDGNDFGVNFGGGIEWFMRDQMSLSMEILLHSIFGEVDSEIFDFTVMFRFFPEK